MLAMNATWVHIHVQWRSMPETHFRDKTIQRSMARRISLSSFRKAKIRFSPIHLHSPPETVQLHGVRDLGFSERCWVLRVWSVEGELCSLSWLLQVRGSLESWPLIKLWLVIGSGSPIRITGQVGRGSQRAFNPIPGGWDRRLPQASTSQSRFQITKEAKPKQGQLSSFSFLRIVSWFVCFYIVLAIMKLTPIYT